MNDVAIPIGFCLSIGVLLLLIDYLLIRRHQMKYTDCTQRVPARIICWNERYKSIIRAGEYQRPMWHPVYEYVADGHVYRYESHYGLTNPRQETVVELRYNPENPEQFYVPLIEDYAANIFKTVLTVLGVLFLVVPPVLVFILYEKGFI